MADNTTGNKRIVGEKFRIFLMGTRQATIIFLGCIEDYLEIDRSITPRHKRGDKEYFEDKKLTAEISKKP